MFRAFANLCRHLPLFRGRRGGVATHRSERLASFMAQHNRRRFDSDLRDATLEGRRVMKLGLRLAVFAAVAWVAVESARALSMF